MRKTGRFRKSKKTSNGQIQNQKETLLWLPPYLAMPNFAKSWATIWAGKYFGSIGFGKTALVKNVVFRGILSILLGFLMCSVFLKDNASLPEKLGSQKTF